MPFPYEFNYTFEKIKLDAPILIVGDRMANHLAKFSDDLAKTISSELSSPIRIQSLASPREGIHRTIHRLESISPWPQILVYQGGSEEFFEPKFLPSEIKTIRKNFKLFDDDRIETLMILYPELSRLIYHPFERIKLNKESVYQTELSEKEFLTRLETEILLYERQLSHLVKMAKDKGSLIILLTTPVKLNAPPKKTCSFTTSIELEAEEIKIRKHLEDGNLKSAFSEIKQLTMIYSSNASLYYLHGEIALQLNDYNEAYTAFEKAAAFDCTSWRSTPLQNNIIRKVAKEQQALLFDMDRFVQSSGDPRTLFYDDIFPQNLYYERSMQQLGLVIKKILKL